MKDFLKPTGAKIIILIVVALIMGTASFFALTALYPGGSQTPFWYIILSPSFAIPLEFLPGRGLIDEIILYGITFLYWYLLSCIIVLLAHKLKGQQQKSQPVQK